MIKSLKEQLTLFDLLLEDVPDVNVDIKGVVNLNTTPISDYDVSMNYGDLTLIISILHDYVITFDKLKEEGKCPINDIEYEAYYRDKFLKIANRLEEQIGYDYEAKKKKCIKKMQRESNSDVGGDALALAMKKAFEKADVKEAAS